MNEEQLRSSLQRAAGRPDASRDLLHRAQLAASERRRRRTEIRSAIAGSALTALLAVAIVVPNLGDSSDKPGEVAQAETEREEIELANSKIEASKPAPASPVTNKRPKTLVGASAAGRLVTIDSVSGKTTKVLTTLSNPTDASKGGLLGRVSLNRDASRVYFDAATSDPCAPAVRAISTQGGPVTDIASGSVPAVSPDGSKLAFVHHEGCDSRSLSIRSLSGGDEQSLALPALESPVTDVVALSWSTDQAMLIADVRTADATASRLVMFNIATGSVKDFLEPSNDAKTGTVWEWPTILPDGNVFVSERCCVAPSGQGSPEDSRLLVVNTSGKLQTVVAYGVVTKSHSATATDAGGNHLMYMSGEDLMVSDERGRPAPLAFGLLGATWR